MASINKKNEDVWQESLSLIKDIQSLTARFPEEEKFALISQMNREAKQISLQLANAAATGISKEKSSFIHRGKEACIELITLTIVAQRLGYITAAVSDEYEKKTASVLNKLATFAHQNEG